MDDFLDKIKETWYYSFQMEEKLKMLVGSVIIVILQLRGNISISIRGELETAFSRYHVPGNPAIVFGIEDVSSIDDNVIRLKG